jgi:hypothetical protein
MPEITYQITGVEPAARGLAPLLHFRLGLTNQDPRETIHGVMLHAQIQVEAPRRDYTPKEKENLLELFGPPERWGDTLRNQLWGHADVSLPGFSGSAETVLPMPCTYDMNLGITKYFHALDGGDISLLFLFSGSIFYARQDGVLQAQRIPWEKECRYRMPAGVWRGMMQRHYPNSVWLTLHRDAFERLAAYKRQEGLATWEQAIDRLLGPDHTEAVAYE